MEFAPVAGGPPAAAASSSSEASQENDQAQANSVGAPSVAGTLGAPSLAKRLGARGRGGFRGSRGRGAGAHRLSLKGRPKAKAAVACASSGVPPWSSYKFVSPEAVVEAARRVKDRLPDVSEELLESLRARGLEPCTLQQVLDERKLQWAVTQARDERAEAEHARLFEAFQRQCEGWGNNREGWVHSKWHSVIEFEKDSDSSADEVSVSKQREASSASSVSADACKHKGKDRAAREAEAEPSNEGKRRVQVTADVVAASVFEHAPAVTARAAVTAAATAARSSTQERACSNFSPAQALTISSAWRSQCVGSWCSTHMMPWQQVFVDGWPHVVLTTIPGVSIEPGDEVLADFGYDWFNRVQDASHKAIARELLDYRIGAKKGGCQTLPPGRKAECVVRDSDLSLQTRARVGEVCPYCHSDEIPNVSSSSSDPEAKSVHGEGGAAASKERNSNESQPLSQAEDSEGTQTESAAKHRVWGEQVVHCDGCDRPCHLRCIFGAHSADLQQPHTEEPQQQQTEQQQQKQEQPHEQQKGEPPVSDANAVEKPCGAQPEGNGPAAFGTVTPGECVEDVYRWFVEGDCKWYCCVCRLQWERMAAAMNFSVDWKARKVLGAGNPLMLRGASEAAAGGSRAAGYEGPCAGEQKPHDKTSVEYSEDRDGSPAKRRCRGGRRGSVVRGWAAKRCRTDASQLPKRVRGSCGGAAEQGVSEALPLVVKAESDEHVLERAESQDKLIDASCLAAAGAADASVSPPVAEVASCTYSGGKSSTSGEALGGVQTEIKPNATSEGVAGLSTAAPESPLSGVDSDAQPKGSGDAGSEQSASGDAASGSLQKKTASADKASQRMRSQGDPQESEEGLVVEEALRVYRNSSERARTSKMQPCPVLLNPAELTAEELLGCRTEMLVEPRALLGALQPCVRCYELYGSKASVEVCRLTKRHLASNWDHPDFASPAQIQDALLSCFQDALLTLQRQHREKLQEVLESMGSFQRDVNVGTLLAGNRYPRIHANAARRSEDTAQDRGINATPKITKGVIPLLAVTLGKTMIDYKHTDPDTKKLRWYHGCVSDYQAIAPEEQDEEQWRKRKASKNDGIQEKKIVYFTNQFGINYDDGDRETVPADRLIEMLVETGPGSKLEGRKAITTTPLAKMLAPGLKMAIRQTNRIVRETNKKGVLTDSESDEE
ncbi:hypothetical protein Emag_003935 [Eimeria magna]